MPVANATPNRGYKEPHISNPLAGDVARLIDALRAIDADVAALLAMVALRATLASPAFSGAPTAPTPSANDRSTKLATTEFVKGQIDEFIGAAPELLDTVAELATALHNNPDIIDNLIALIGAKADGDDTRITGALQASDLPSQPEAEAGVAATARAWSALRVRQAVMAAPVATGAVKGLMSAADKIKVDGVAAGAQVGRGVSDWIIEDQKASGAAGGTPTNGAFVKRTLNTIVKDPAGLVSLSSDEFVSSVGGEVFISAPAARVSNHRVRLYNVTDAVVVGYGSSEYTTRDYWTQTTSVGRFPILAGKTYRVEHWVENNNYGSLGFGDPCGIAGIHETYSRVEFWRA